MMKHKNPHWPELSLLLKTLPSKPGVYRFLDEQGRIIYIGKAKNLKKRVSSYFTKVHNTGKLKVLVTRIADIKTIIVDNEWEALLLENSMIKEHRPRYNVMLKDDKTYPWIAISKEPFPRIYYTREPDWNNNLIFGPYPSIRYMHTLLDTLFEVFPFRSCKTLSKNSRPCLQYHIKRCAAPCAGLISEEEYLENIDKAITIIKGKNHAVIKLLKDEMMQFAEAWEFEKAQAIKERIEILETYIGKSVVVNPNITDCDVFTIHKEEELAYINFMRIVEGSIVHSYTLEYHKAIDNSVEELLLMGIVEVEKRSGQLSPEIILPFDPQIETDQFKFTVPQRGDKKKLLELSEKNLKFYILEQKKKAALIDPEKNQKRILETVRKDLGMNNPPVRIECFDNSNTGGAEPVSAMVCFINGKPAKKEYRHFLIKSVEGADDFATMKEVIERRYKRVLEEQLPLPDLIIIDGGKGQLHAAQQALQELGIDQKVMLIAIAERLEEIYRVGEAIPLYINKKSETQRLIQQIRDEVHRFAITHHRKRRAKKSIGSELDQIPGIGPKSKEKLLTHFKSMKRIANAPWEEWVEQIGPSKSLILKKYFENKNKAE